MSSANVLPRPQAAESAASCRQVEPAEFCRLAVSYLKLSRSDDVTAGLRGLLDEVTGERYVVDTAKLARFQATDNN